MRDTTFGDVLKQTLAIETRDMLYLASHVTRPRLPKLALYILPIKFVFWFIGRFLFMYDTSVTKKLPYFFAVSLENKNKRGQSIKWEGHSVYSIYDLFFARYGWKRKDVDRLSLEEGYRLMQEIIYQNELEIERNVTLAGGEYKRPAWMTIEMDKSPVTEVKIPTHLLPKGEIVTAKGKVVLNNDNNDDAGKTST